MKKLNVKLLFVTLFLTLHSSASSNAAPINSTLPTISGVNQVNSILRASRGTWSGTVESYIYQWRRCTDPVNSLTCAAISGQTSTNYTLVAADAGKYIRFNVIAVDSSGATSSVLSLATSQIVAPPTNSSRPSISGSSSLGSTLTTTNGTWSQPNQGIYRYRWYRCSSTQESSCTVILGAIANSYVISDNDIGKNIRSEVTVFESTGKVSASVKSNNTGFISSIPKNLSSPIISGSATTNEKLTLNLGTWVAYPEATYSQKWQRCSSVSIDSCQDIANQTMLEYTTSSSDLNNYLRVSVTGLNNLGGTIKFSPLFGPIMQQIIPTNTQAPSISGMALEGNTLTLSNGDWSGLPTPTFTYKWFRCESPENCSEIASANQNTYLLTVADGNNRIKAAVTGTNSLGSSTASTPLIDVKGAYEILVKPEIQGQVAVGKILSVDNGTWFPAPDVGYVYKWQTCASKNVASCVDSKESTNKYTVKITDAVKYLRAGVSLNGKSSFVFSKLTKQVPGGKIIARKGSACSKAKARTFGPKGNILICKKRSGRLIWT